MTSIPHSNANPSPAWTQPHYTAEQQLQLEEQCAYLFQPPQPRPRHIHPSPRSGSVQRPYSGALPQTARFPSFTQNQFNATSSPAFVQQDPSSFSQSSSDPNGTQWDAASTTFGAAPIQTQHTPAYTRSGPDQSPYQSHSSSLDSANRSQPGTSTHPARPAFMGPGPMQFPFTQPPPQRQSELQAQYFGMQQGPSKRPRQHEDEDPGDPDSPQEHDNATKQKPNSACGRCRGLKVRCEFVGDNDFACKRCAQAGQECTIPDRKPRRRPPKREHLLNRIRDQASQIERLMAQLEQSKSSVAVSSPSDPHSPLPTTPGMDPHSEAVVPKPEVQDWIAKARESLQTFGGLLPAVSSSNNGRNSTDEEADDENSEDDSGYDTAEDKLPKVGASPTSSTKKKDVSAPKYLPNEEAPYGLLAHLSIKANPRQKSVEPESSDAVGVARVDFFRPSPAPDPIRTSELSNGMKLPYILSRGIVTVQEVDTLFDIYFKRMNPSISLLDPKLHTPQYVVMKSPFLFTVVCAIASRFYTERPDLYEQLMNYAQLAAGSALITGTKNEEMCAAYLLMQLYPVPAKRWEEDRGWIYLGVGIRIAQDINLNRPITTKPLNEHHARCLLSRTRIWLNCHNLDRSTGSQYGKPPIIPNADYVACHSETWWQSSQYNLRGFDIQTCIYNMELRLMCEFFAQIYSDPSHPLGLNKGANFTQIASKTDDALRRLGERWFPYLDEFDRESSDSVFRSELLKMSSAYQRLVALSAGLKYAKQDELDENSFLKRCLEAASDVVNAFVRRLFVTPEQKVYLRHAPEGQFVFVTFAGAFLVKLLQPKYAHYFPAERRKEIRSLVQEAVDLLGSAEVAIDEKHAPKLYSRFLASLLANMATDAPARTSNSNGISAGMSASVSKKPSTRARGKIKEYPMLSTPQPQGPGANQLSSSSPSFATVSRWSPTFNSSLRSLASTTMLASGSASSPTSTRHSQSPSPPLSSPPKGLLNVIPPQQQQGHQNMPSSSITSTSTLAEGSGNSARGNSITSSDLFQAPMVIDADLLESMQFMTDPAWQDTTVPGFGWMVNQFDTGSTTDYSALFGSTQYDSTLY